MKTVIGLTITILMLTIYIPLTSCKENKGLSDFGKSKNTKISGSGTDSEEFNEEGNLENEGSMEDVDIVTYGNAANMPDIKTTVQGEGNTIILTYNEKNKAMRIEVSGQSIPTYMDEEGGLYNFDDNSGWIRMNLGGLAGKSMGGIMEGNTENLNNLMAGGYIDQDDYEKATSTRTFGEKFNMGSSNFFFPMVEWGMRFRASEFERNTNFKKQLVDCGKPAPCKKFVGVAEQEKGVQATFEPGGRLIKLLFHGKTMDYEYGNFPVQLPEAQEFKFPF